jgi:hypothetical protein
MADNASGRIDCGLLIANSKGRRRDAAPSVYFAFRNQQSAISNPQSAIRNQQSAIDSPWLPSLFT